MTVDSETCESYDLCKSDNKSNFAKSINDKTEVTSVKLILFKSVMWFETLTKEDRLVRTRPGLTVVLSSV